MTAPSLSSYANGINQVSGDNLSTFVQWSVTYAQLKAFNPNPAVPNLQVFMQGYSAPGDGGQGNFYWSTTTGTDDGGITTVVPSGSTAGCWIRIPNFAAIYAPQTVNNAAGQTLTAANVTNQVLLRTEAASVTDTFPTASAIIGAMSGAQPGAIRDLLIVNENSGTLLISPGSGVAFSGNLSTGNFSIPTLTQRVFKIYYASASAVTVYG